MSKLNVKKNDQVLVTTGKDRGARGRVLRVLASEGKAIVERVNMIKRHTRPHPQRGIQGGIRLESPDLCPSGVGGSSATGPTVVVGWRCRLDGRWPTAGARWS